MDSKQELECGHRLQVSLGSSAVWCPMCDGMVMVREPAA